MLYKLSLYQPDNGRKKLALRSWEVNAVINRLTKIRRDGRRQFTTVEVGPEHRTLLQQ